MRAVRKLTSYICTQCFQVFPTAQDARAHYRKSHSYSARAKHAAPKKRGETSAARVLRAIDEGASSAKDIQKATKLPLKRVHSFLTYLRKQGLVEGYREDLRVVPPNKRSSA